MDDKMPYFSGRVLFNGIATSYLFMTCGTSTWLACIIGTILGAVILLLFKNNNCKFSKFTTGFILSFLALTILVNMGHSLYLKNTPILVLTLIPVTAIFFMSNTKKSGLKKVINVLFIYSLFLFILELLGLAPSIKMTNLMPYFQNDLKSVIVGASIFALTSVTPIIALNETMDKKNSIIYYLVSTLTVQVISFLAISVLGQKEVLLYRYPETVVLKRIEFLNFISSVDSFFTFAVIVDVLMTMYLGLKNIEGSSSSFGKYVSLITITVLVIWACYNYWPLLVIYKYFPFILIFLLFITIVPIKSKYKNEQK